MHLTRLPAKRAIIVGAGQTPGDTIGNGRAIATLFARESAQILCVDCDGERRPAGRRRNRRRAVQADIRHTEEHIPHVPPVVIEAAQISPLAR